MVDDEEDSQSDQDDEENEEGQDQLWLDVLRHTAAQVTFDGCHNNDKHRVSLSLDHNSYHCSESLCSSTYYRTSTLLNFMGCVHLGRSALLLFHALHEENMIA